MTHFSNRELGTVLAALRSWDALGDGAPQEIEDIATGDGEFEQLSSDEIDALCERINTEAPLSIEVSAVRRDASGWETCNEDERGGEGFGVYIRSPLALHIRDFLVPDWWGSGAQQFDDAKGAAFSFADNLAEHLGCAVDSKLSRPAVPFPAVDPELMREYIDAGASLWEAALALRRQLTDDEGDAMFLAGTWQRGFTDEWDDFGTSHMRYMVGDLAKQAHHDFIAATERTFSGSFDWDFAPEWLNDALKFRYGAAGASHRPMVAGDIHDIDAALAVGAEVAAEVALRAAEGALMIGDTNCGGDDSVYSEPLRLVRAALAGQAIAAPHGSEAEWRAVVARGHTTQGYDSWLKVQQAMDATAKGGAA